MRKIEWVFLILGLVLFVGLLHRVGWGELLRQFREIGWWFGLVLVVSGCRYLARVAAWRRALPGKQDLPSFAQMFQVRLAGETLNYLSIAGPFLGEPAKAALMRERLPLAVGLGGTLIEAGVYMLTSGWVMLIGLVLGLLRVAVNDEMRRAGWITAALLAVTLLGAWWLLHRQVRFVSAGLRWFGRTPLARWVERQRPRLEELEGQLLQFYSLHAGDFRAIFAWNSLAQVFAMLEIYVILAVLGVRVGWADLLILEGMTKIVKLLFFFVPARVGTDEAGSAAVFQVLGMGIALGVGLALVRRLRAMVWSAVGIVFLSRYALR